MRQCKKCGEKRPIREFPLNGKIKGGREYRCKPCVRVLSKIWRDANAEHVKEYFRKKNREPATLARKKESRKAWGKKNPEKVRAHSTFWRAIRRGLVTKRPCEVCGATEVHAHHENYDSPLTVRWLCAEHHARLHHRGESK